VPGPLDVSGIAQKAVSGEVQPQAWPLPVSYACIQDIGLSPVAWTGNKFSFAALTPGVFTATCQGTNAAGTGPEFQIRFTATVSDPGEDTGNAAVTTVVHANLAGQDATVTTSGPASGAIQVGDRLTNDIQAPAGWAWHYQWYRTVKTVKNKKAATAWKAIRRATGSYYKPTVADAGKKIRARITFTQGPTQVVVWTKARSVAKVGATVKLTGVWKNGKPAVKVKITAKKGLKNPTGTIAVRVNGTRTVVKLRSTHKGVVTVPLRKVTLGTATRIKASYSGPAATAKRVATATVTFTGR
jgi:hypothetical protein